MIESIVDGEFYLLDLMQNLRGPFQDRFFSAVTHLGDAGAVWIITGAVMLAFKKYRRCGISVLLSLLLCACVTSGIIKPMADRLRPYEVKQILISIPMPFGASFPSGHTSSSFAAAFSIFLLHKRESVPAFVVAVMIAFSRMYFYVHFPTDVLVGALVGILSAFAVVYTLKRRANIH